jgi:hypothetical protein
LLRLEIKAEYSRSIKHEVVLDIINIHPPTSPQTDLTDDSINNHMASVPVNLEGKGFAKLL